MISPKEIAIVLTCTIDVKGISLMERSAVELRLADYQLALARWLDDPWVRNLIVVENSGYPLDALEAQVAAHKSGKTVEFLSFDGQDFPRQLGKGFGETRALTHVAMHSRVLASAGRFMKVNGRYYVPNVARVLSGMTAQTAVYFNINKSMTFADSRVFGGDVDFLNYVCREGRSCDDSNGVWLEHALARAGLRAIADGKPWAFITTMPKIAGISGTENKPYVEPLLRRWKWGRANALKQRLLRW